MLLQSTHIAGRAAGKAPGQGPDIGQRGRGPGGRAPGRDADIPAPPPAGGGAGRGSVFAAVRRSGNERPGAGRRPAVRRSGGQAVRRSSVKRPRSGRRAGPAPRTRGTSGARPGCGWSRCARRKPTASRSWDPLGTSAPPPLGSVTAQTSRWSRATSCSGPDWPRAPGTACVHCAPFVSVGWGRGADNVRVNPKGLISNCDKSVVFEGTGDWLGRGVTNPPRYCDLVFRVRTAVAATGWPAPHGRPRRRGNPPEPGPVEPHRAKSGLRSGPLRAAAGAAPGATRRPDATVVIRGNTASDLLKRDARARELRHRARTRQVGTMDAVDRRLIDALRADGRASYAELA